MGAAIVAACGSGLNRRYNHGMPTMEFECVIAAPIEAVWAFHEDVRRALPLLSPPENQVKLESVDLPPRQGMRVVISARGPLGRMRWVAVYAEHVPPHDVVFGREARFVDVQESGPFKRWRHHHEMEAQSAQSTRLVDRVEYTAPLGPLGWIADWLLIRRQLRRMFAYRHAMTKQALEQPGSA